MKTSIQQDHAMTSIHTDADAHTDTMVVPAVTAAEKQEQLKQQYPRYYSAWRTMHSNYGKNQVSLDWRGTIGLMKFIEDTSVLDNNPDVMDALSASTGIVGLSVKLKRLQPAFAFSPQNVYWYIPRDVKKLLDAASTFSTSSNERMHAPIQLPQPVLPSVLSDIVPVSIESIRETYNTTPLMETRMEELFNESMTRTLSTIEQAELDILGKLIAGEEITPVETISKYEDI